MARQPTLFDRHVTPALEAALADTPVVLLVGPRQAGKTTLCRLVADRRGARLLSLDDAATLAAATADPAGFIAGIEGPVVLDEIQKAPALLPAIKLAVDRRREPGRFLLTGSADVLALPRVSESLAGRTGLSHRHRWRSRRPGLLESLDQGRRDAVPERLRRTHVGPRLLVVADSQVRRSAVGVGPAGVPHGQVDRPGEVRDRRLVPLLRDVDRSAVVVRAGVRGVDLEGAVAVGQGRRVLVERGADEAAIGVRRREVGLEADRAVEVRDGFAISLRLDEVRPAAERASPRRPKDGTS